MQTEPPKADPPKRKRRWFQFSLRTLLILIAAVAVVCGLVARRVERKRIEREAVDAIVKLGGTVYYDYESGAGAEPPGPQWLRNFLGDNFFCELEGILFINEPARVTDSDLDDLRAFAQLNRLWLSGAKITDAGLGCLDGLTELRELSLSDTAVTDASVAHFKRMIHLEQLDLSATRITDAGLAEISRLSRLQALFLWGTTVSDGGLAHLEKLTNLQSLSLVDTKATDAGVKKLQTALPDCSIGF